MIRLTTNYSLTKNLFKDLYLGRRILKYRVLRVTLGFSVHRTHGLRYKSRKLLTKKPREKGRPGISRWLYEYKVGDKVVIDIDPTFITTAPHRRYQGKVGTIISRRGNAYEIELYVGSKRKIIITTPDHIVPFKTQQSVETGLKASYR